MEAKREARHDDEWDEDDGAAETKFLTFIIGTECYALSVSFISEIIGLQDITTVPDVPTFVKGLINLRGKVIPVIDVRLRFQMEACEYGPRSCIIVVEHEKVSVGLLVDTVKEVVDIPDSDIEPVPNIGSSELGSFVSAIGKVEDAVRLILDVNRVLFIADENGLPSALSGSTSETSNEVETLAVGAAV